MIWATVSSRSCFCWLYTASPSLATKNVINLISVLIIWWCPCVKSSHVLLKKGVCFYQCILLAEFSWSLLCFILYSQGQTCLLLQVSLDFLLLNSCPLCWIGFFFFFGILGFIGLHRTDQIQLLQHWWLGHRLGLLWFWMVCLGHELRPFCHF